MSYLKLEEVDIATMYQIEKAVIEHIWESPYPNPTGLILYQDTLLVEAYVEGFMHQCIRITHYKPEDIILNIQDLVGIPAGEASRYIVTQVQKHHKMMKLLDGNHEDEQNE